LRISTIRLLLNQVKLMIRALIVTFGILVALIVTPSIASAHQSGCHRWHSCPSDSGSYVCGDLGYYSGCGGTTTTYTEPDYTEQGNENGKAKASDDESAIQTAADADGQEAGHEDGSSDKTDSPSPDATATCDKTFTYASPQPQEYIDSFHDNYLDACTETYNSAYNAAYETAYKAGEDQRTAADTATDSSASSSDSSDSSGWWILGGFGALVGGSALYDKIRKK
jgi:hypothetical protein